jgi:hypothetical protein
MHIQRMERRLLSRGGSSGSLQEREDIMKKSFLTALALLLVGCATTYHLPEEERSRAYQADEMAVWDAALASVEDIGLALVEAEEEHGRIRARAGWSIWDLKGHKLLVTIRPLEEGRVRVDANAETVSDDQDIDFGRSKGIVRDYLNALDKRLASGNS